MSARGISHHQHRLEQELLDPGRRNLRSAERPHPLAQLGLVALRDRGGEADQVPGLRIEIVLFRHPFSPRLGVGVGRQDNLPPPLTLVPRSCCFPRRCLALSRPCSPRRSSARSSPSAGAAQASPYLPLDDPRLPLIEHLIARGDIADPSPMVRPFRRADALRVLARRRHRGRGSRGADPAASRASSRSRRTPTAGRWACARARRPTATSAATCCIRSAPTASAPTARSWARRSSDPSRW